MCWCLQQCCQNDTNFLVDTTIDVSSTLQYEKRKERKKGKKKRRHYYGSYIDFKHGILHPISNLDYTASISTPFSSFYYFFLSLSPPLPSLEVEFHAKLAECNGAMTILTGGGGII